MCFSANILTYRRERLIPLTKSPFFDPSTIQYRDLRQRRRESSNHALESGTYGGVNQGHMRGPSAFLSGTPGSAQSEVFDSMLTADEVKELDSHNDEERGERPPAWLDLVCLPFYPGPSSF